MLRTVPFTIFWTIHTKIQEESRTVISTMKEFQTYIFLRFCWGKNVYNLILYIIAYGTSFEKYQKH